MKLIAPKVALVVVLFLSACSSSLSTIPKVPAELANSVDVTQLPSMRVVGLVVTVPETLVVSEANSYKPIADIVWRGDPFGDRYAQVKAIFEESIARGAASLQGDLPVVLHITVRRFHALTERTRYSIGGEHEIEFMLSVTNGRTGDVVVPPYLVRTVLKGFGGEEALEAERLGQTQKKRIGDHLAALIVQELTGVPAPLAGAETGGDVVAGN